MIRALYHSPGEPLRTDVRPTEFPDLARGKDGLLWVDFEGEPPEACEPILRAFGFHPLAIDDALTQTNVPKVDDWGDYLYVVLNTLSLVEKDGAYESDIDELDVFLGGNYVISHHDDPLAAVNQTWEACQRDERHLQQDQWNQRVASEHTRQQNQQGIPGRANDGRAARPEVVGVRDITVAVDRQRQGQQVQVEELVADRRDEQQTGDAVRTQRDGGRVLGHRTDSVRLRMRHRFPECQGGGGSSEPRDRGRRNALQTPTIASA